MRRLPQLFILPISGLNDGDCGTVKKAGGGREKVAIRTALIMVKQQ